MLQHSTKRSEAYEELFSIKPKTIYTLLPNEIELLPLMKQLKLQLGYFPGVLSEDPAVIDSLTIKENMLVALSFVSNQPKRALDLLVNETLEELSIPISLADQHFKDLPLKLSLQFQLHLNVLCNKKVILIDDWFKYESDPAKQDWLLIFRHFARTTGCSFILFTSDENLLTLGYHGRIDSFHPQRKLS